MHEAHDVSAGLSGDQHPPAPQLQELPLHPVAELFPPMREKEFQDLVADIREHGLREAIWTHQGKIIDGRHRWLACKQLGIAPRTREWDGSGSLLEFVIGLNLRRRHLKETQRAMIAARMMPAFEEEARQRQRTGGQGDLGVPGPQGRSADNAGTALNVSRSSVRRACKVLEHGVPALIAAVDRGKIGVKVAAALAARTPEEQTHLLEQGRAEIAKTLRQDPRSFVEQKADELLLGSFFAGNAKLAQTPRGLQLELSLDCYNELSLAMRNRTLVEKLMERGVWMKIRNPDVACTAGVR